MTSKRVLSFIVFLSLCLTAFSCVRNRGAEQTETPNIGTEFPEDSSTNAPDSSTSPEPHDTPEHAEPLRYSEVFDPQTDYDNRFGRGYASMTETQDAYYFCAPKGEYCRYYDKAVGESGVLCGKPECMHDAVKANKSCNGYISHCDSWISCCCGKLYFVSENPNKPAESCLYCMELDGTGRKELLRFDPEDPHNSGDAYIHRGKLFRFGAGEVVRESVPTWDWFYTCTDIETGETTVIREFESSADCPRPVPFFFGDYVYVIESRFTDNKTRIPLVEIFRWSIKSGELEKVYSAQDPAVLGLEFTIWVEAEDEIYIAPTMRQRGEEQSKFFRISDGRITKTFAFGETGSVRLVDGAAVAVNFLVEEGTNVQVMDFEGNLLYKADLTTDFINRLGSNMKRAGYMAVLGSADELFFVFIAEYADKSRAECLVRYKKTGEGLEETLLCADIKKQ
jgi:hypothetical protein